MAAKMRRSPPEHCLLMIAGMAARGGAEITVPTTMTDGTEAEGILTREGGGFKLSWLCAFLLEQIPDSMAFYLRWLM